MTVVKVPESQIQDQIRGYLDAKRILCWRMPIGPVMFGTGAKTRWGKSPLKGFPDLAGVLPGGQLLVIEVKTKKGLVSDDQVEWRRKLEAAGAFYVLARSLNDVIVALKNRGDVNANV